MLAAAGPGADLGSPLFISGFSVGSEVVAARGMGFERIWGVEVDTFLHEVAEARLRHLPEVHLVVYDGGRLPYTDESFGWVTSSHIVEHTRDPTRYLGECMRVLKPGGYFSLEFPTRYHTRELHTGLPSLEWLPGVIRNWALRVLASPYSPAREGVKQKCRSIVETELRQVSYGSVRRAIRKAGFAFSVASFERPAPGVVRVVFRRELSPR
jgi:ubiquinone/menaquinone biosynthesis C-methylase UbiE